MATLYTTDFSVDDEATNWQAGENGSGGTALVISGGQCTINAPSAPSIQRTTTSAHAATADMKVTVKRVSGSSWDAGPVARSTASNTTYYLDVYGSNNIDVYRRVAGADTLIGSRNATHANGDTYALEVSGTGATVTFKVFRNGSQVGANLTDTSGSRITAAGQAGLLSWTGAAMVFDDFLVEDLAAAGGGAFQSCWTIQSNNLIGGGIS